jgi:hypothetical protein
MIVVTLARAPPREIARRFSRNGDERQPGRANAMRRAIESAPLR